MISSIKYKILFVVTVILVISLSLNTALNYYVSESYNRKSINSTLAALADSNTSTIEEWVKSRIKQISNLTSYIVQPDPEPVLKEVAASGGFSDVHIAFPDRRVIASTISVTDLPEDYDPTQRAWYLQAAKEKQTVVATPYQDALSGKLTVTIATPLFINNELKGVVAGDILMDNVIAEVRDIHPTERSFGMLIDKQGGIIAHPRENLTMKPLSEISENLNLSQLLYSSIPVEATLSGEKVYLLAHPVKDTSWYVVVAMNKADVQSGMHSLLKTSLISLSVLLILSIVIVSYVMRQIISPLMQVRKFMDEFFSTSQIDLTQRLPVKGKDEVAQIAMAFNSFTDKLVEVMSSIRHNSAEIRTVAVGLSTGNNDLALRTEESASSLQQTSASLEQISSTVAQALSMAHDANMAVVATESVAQRGRESVRDVIDSMNEIEAVSSQISSITGVINDIAFQTNILALNASVEAARAGEQGRGFAVVANEVRALASRSAQSAKDISSLIEKTVLSVKAGARQVDDTDTTMQEIVSSVSSVATFMSGIRQAAEEQTKGIDEINKAVAQLDSMVQRNASLVEESKTSSAELLEQTNGLSDVVSRYRIS